MPIDPTIRSFKLNIFSIDELGFTDGIGFSDGCFFIVIPIYPFSFGNDFHRAVGQQFSGNNCWTVNGGSESIHQ